MDAVSVANITESTRENRMDQIHDATSRLVDSKCGKMIDRIHKVVDQIVVQRTQKRRDMVSTLKPHLDTFDTAPSDTDCT